MISLEEEKHLVNMFPNIEQRIHFPNESGQSIDNEVFL
jgi:hypothetical protein